MGVTDIDWSGLVSSGLQIGAQIYQGQLYKKQMRQTARAQIAGGSADFPQLGMGLAATGPQRAVGGTPTGGSGLGAWGPGGFFGLQTGAPMDDTSSVQVMRGSRFPTQLVVYTTPNGTMQVGGYRSIGRPLLWSGDFAAVKRVARVARKLGRFVHRRPR